MVKPKVFVTRIIPDAGLNLIRAACDADVWPGSQPPPREVILSKALEIDGILCLLTDSMDVEFMDAARKLKVISNYAVGLDNVDVPAAQARGIRVGYTPGVLTETTADFAFTLMLSAARCLVPGVNYVKAGKWQTWEPMLLLGQEIHHATLGIVGLGRIGTEVAKRAKGFDMRVFYYGRQRQPDKEREYGFEFRDLDDLLHESDFVSLHTPLTPETHHLINARTLGLMKRNAVLVNTSRGPVVDLEALYDALRSGTICAAGLDVTEPEPLTPDSKLLTLDNCIVVPHIASATVAARSAMALLAAQNLLAGLEGRPLPATPKLQAV